MAFFMRSWMTSAAFEKFFFVCGHDEEIDQGAADRCVFAFPNVFGTLDIEIHHDIATYLKISNHFGAECAVEIAVDFGAFEEIAVFAFGEKLFTAEEMVVLAIGFAGARGAGGAGYRVMRLVLASQTPAQGGFSRSRWSGDH
jgi:hypothetical protein